MESEVELPRTESDFEVIASSFGLLSPDKIPPEIQEGILNPKMFSERRLYLDPDIIGKPFISFTKTTISQEDCKINNNGDIFIFLKLHFQKKV